jgi:hypothetical protein
MWIPEGLYLSTLCKRVLTMGITLWTTLLLESVNSTWIQRDQTFWKSTFFHFQLQVLDLVICRVSLSVGAIWAVALISLHLATNLIHTMNQPQKPSTVYPLNQVSTLSFTKRNTPSTVDGKKSEIKNILLYITLFVKGNYPCQMGARCTIFPRELEDIRSKRTSRHKKVKDVSIFFFLLLWGIMKIL